MNIGDMVYFWSATCEGILSLKIHIRRGKLVSKDEKGYAILQEGFFRQYIIFAEHAAATKGELLVKLGQKASKVSYYSIVDHGY